MRWRTITTAAIGGLALSLLHAPPSWADTTFMVDTSFDSVDANPGDGVCADSDGRCSLRAAVQEANALEGDDTIDLDGRTTSLTLPGTGEDAAASGDLDVTSNITIQGGGGTVNARSIDRAFDVLSDSLTVQGMAVVNGQPEDGASGGGFRNAASLTIISSRVEFNVAEGTGASGGGVFNDGGELVVTNAVIVDNSATRAGGGIEANEGTTTLDGVTLSNNDTGPEPGNGGGLHLTGEGTVSVTESIVRGNTASAEGGGLWNSATGTMDVLRSSIDGNTASGADADQGGGGLFNDGGLLTIARSQVVFNVADGASGSGGGILNNLGTLEVTNVAVNGNTAVRAGGGIEANVGTTTVFQSTLSDNDTGPTPGNGGGLHLTGAGQVSVSQSIVAGNTATAEGGGLWNSATGTMGVNRVSIRDNTASGDAADQGGGGIFSDGGSLTVDRSQIRNNAADGESGSGGGLLNNLGSATITNTGFAGNTATRAGGGIEANVGDTVLFQVVLAGNTTGDNPGNGGGLHLTGAGTVIIDRSQISRNDAANEGGGLWNSATGTMTVTRSAIRDNTAPDGPDVYNDGGNFTIDGRPVPVG